MNKSNQIVPQPSILWFLIVSYSMVMVLANWFDIRLIRIFSLDTDAGTLVRIINIDPGDTTDFALALAIQKPKY